MADDTIRKLATADAPAANGPYSQAVVAVGWLYSAGQIALPPAGRGPDASDLVSPDVGEQAEQVFANLAAVLGAAGASLKDVVKTTVYLADMDDFARVNEIYARHFSEPYPARSTVAAQALPKGALVEIDVVARLP